MVSIPSISFVTGKSVTYWGSPISSIGLASEFVFGVVLIAYAAFKPRYELKIYYICPSCEEVEKLRGLDSKLCEKCNTNLVLLEGFYS